MAARASTQRSAGERPRPAPELPMLLDINGVAERLGVNERHIRRLVAERRIPYIKWGHLLRFDAADIAEWLDDVRVHPRY